MKDLIQQFFLYFSIASSIAIWIVHKYLQWKLGGRHDKGYYYMSIAFAFWAAMAWTEWVTPDASKEDNPWRIVFSSLNNSFLVLSLSFIDHGWSNVSRRIQKLGWIPIAGFIAVTTFLTGTLYGGESHQIAWVDAIWSVTVLILLFAGFAVTFSKPQRNMKLMMVFSVLTGALFVFTQLYVLNENGHLEWTWLQTINGNLIRMLTRPMLLICTLALSLTWLGVGGASKEKVQNQSEEQTGSLREKFKAEYEVSDDDLEILKRLAEGESMPQIAKDFKRYDGDGDKLQREVVKRLANRFGLAYEKYICVVIFAIQKEAIDVKSLKIK